MRQQQRKTIEELYGNTLGAPKSQVTGRQTNISQKIGQKTERNNGYIITSNAPYSGPVALPITASNSEISKNFNINKGTSRRKSARHSNKQTAEQFMNTEKDSFVAEEVKHGQNMKIKMNKNEKASIYVSPTITNTYDNKAYSNYKKNVLIEDGNPQYQHHHHHHNHRHNDYDEDKDDDTVEFLDLIRQTVENAIGKSISELLNRNFRELVSKIEHLSSNLNNTNALLNQIQVDMTKKIVHYGEENSRHFRYLCMKSEYDKMFYQHQTMMTIVKPPTISSATNTKVKKSEKRKSSPKLNENIPKMQRNEGDKFNQTTNLSCQSCNEKLCSPEIKEAHRISSENISQKSSDVGMRQILESIEKFYNKMQLNEVNDVVSEINRKEKIFGPENLVRINRDIFVEDDDDDELDFSSDDLTPRCKQNSTPKYGETTQRGDVTNRGSIGGGDG